MSDALICVTAKHNVVLCLRSDLTPEEVRSLSAKEAGENSFQQGGRWKALRTLPPSIDSVAKNILELENDELKVVLKNKLLDIVTKEQLMQDFSWAAVAEGKHDPFVERGKGMMKIMIFCAVKSIVDKVGIDVTRLHDSDFSEEVATDGSDACSCKHPLPGQRPVWMSIGEEVRVCCFRCYTSCHLNSMQDINEVGKRYVKALMLAVVKDIVKRKNKGSIDSACLKGSMSVVETCLSTFYQTISNHFLGRAVKEAYKRGLEGVIARSSLQTHVQYTVVWGSYCPATYNLMMSDSDDSDATVYYPEPTSPGPGLFSDGSDAENTHPEPNSPGPESGAEVRQEG